MVKLKNDHMCQCTFVMLVVKGSRIEQRDIRQKLELHDTGRMDYSSRGWANYFYPVNKKKMQVWSKVDRVALELFV